MTISVFKPSARVMSSEPPSSRARSLNEPGRKSAAGRPRTLPPSSRTTSRIAAGSAASVIQTLRAGVCLRTLFSASLTMWNKALASAREVGSVSGQSISISMPNSRAKRLTWRRTAGTRALSPLALPVRRPEISSRSVPISAFTSSASEVISARAGLSGGMRSAAHSTAYFRPR